MVSKPFATKQIARLAQSLGYPKAEKEALNELVSELEKAAHEQEASAFITHWLEEYPPLACPKPAEIKRKLFLAKKERDDQREKCRECGGVGFITGDYLVTSELNHATGKVSYTKSLVSEEQARDLRKLPLPKSQQILAGSEPCKLCNALVVFS